MSRPHNILQLKTPPKAYNVFCSEYVLNNGCGDRETKSNQRESQARNYQVLLGQPVTVSFIVPCILRKRRCYCTYSHKLYFFSRTRKAEKRKDRTEKHQLRDVNVDFSLTRIQKTSPYLSWLSHTF